MSHIHKSYRLLHLSILHYRRITKTSPLPMTQIETNWGIGSVKEILQINEIYIQSRTNRALRKPWAKEKVQIMIYWLEVEFFYLHWRSPVYLECLNADIGVNNNSTRRNRGIRGKRETLEELYTRKNSHIETKVVARRCVVLNFVSKIRSLLPYSPDLAPCDFFLYPHWSTWLINVGSELYCILIFYQSITFSMSLRLIIYRYLVPYFDG